MVQAVSFSGTASSAVMTSLHHIITSNPRWDKRFFTLQVMDAKTDCLEQRGLMTTKDASIAFDLRCDVREALLKYIRDEMPEAIPRNRLLMAADPSTPPVILTKVRTQSQERYRP